LNENDEQKKLKDKDKRLEPQVVNFISILQHYLYKTARIASAVDFSTWVKSSSTRTCSTTPSLRTRAYRFDLVPPKAPVSTKRPVFFAHSAFPSAEREGKQKDYDMKRGNTLVN